MPINRRRAPSSEISSEKKMGGHSREDHFATLINGEVIRGTQKADIFDKNGNRYSVKSGKKWQIFLYGLSRIRSSEHLVLMEDCINAFCDDAEKYFTDREICIAYKEGYLRNFGRDEAKKLSNSDLKNALGSNEYMSSKHRLMLATQEVRLKLESREKLNDFLDEAFFNCNDVDMLAIRDDTFRKDNIFKVFAREDVLGAFCDNIFVETSKAGKVPQDYNVEGQKTLLRYKKNSRDKNLGELEIRNDSREKYRLVRFNMYSADALAILLGSIRTRNYENINDNVIAYGGAVQLMRK